MSVRISLRLQIAVELSRPLNAAARPVKLVRSNNRQVELRLLRVYAVHGCAEHAQTE